MDPRDKIKLQRNYAQLLDVLYSSISPHLISTFVLTLEMHEDIDSKRTERKKMEKLLSLLPSRGGNAMKELIKALKPSYSWIALLLENNDNDSARASCHQRNNNLRNLPETTIDGHVRRITQILGRNTRVCSHWTFLAHSMALMPTTIKDIQREMSYSGGHEYAIFCVLEGWVTKVGSSRATFSKLLSILRLEEMNQSVEEVTEYWRSLNLNGLLPDNNHNESQAYHHLPRARSPEITDV